MAIEDDKINKNSNELKNNTYGKNISERAGGYTKGAVVGGIIGLLSGYYFKWNMPICIVVGIVGGGYIGHNIISSSQEKQEFNFKRK